MTGARGLTKRYNLRHRPPDHLQTTPPVAAVANENQHDSADDTAEADSAHVGYDNDSVLTSEADIKSLRKLGHVSHAETGTEDLQKTAPAASNGNHHGNNNDSTEANSTSINKSKRVHMSKDTQKKRRNIFRFGDLPAELRNEIYRLSLTASGPITLRERLWPHSDRNAVAHYPKLGFTTNLLLINKATYAEAGPILYNNHFYFSESKAFFIFFASLSVTAKSWIQELTLELWKFETPDIFPVILAIDDEEEMAKDNRTYFLPAFTVMVGTKNLKHLHFNFRDVNYDDFDMNQFVINMYGTNHFWLEAMRRERGSYEAVVELIGLKIMAGSYYDDYTPADWDNSADASRTSEVREKLLQKLHQG